MAHDKKEEKRVHRKKKRKGMLRCDPLPSMASEPTTPL
jgi:hypothetical protein